MNYTLFIFMYIYMKGFGEVRRKVVVLRSLGGSTKWLPAKTRFFNSSRFALLVNAETFSSPKNLPN